MVTINIQMFKEIFMTQEQFIEAMREHIKWLKKKGGKKADFTG